MSEVKFQAGGSEVLVQASESSISILGLDAGLFASASKQDFARVLPGVVDALQSQGATMVAVDLVTGQILLTGKFSASFIEIILKIVPVAIPLVIAVINDIKNGKSFFEALLSHLPEIINIVISLFSK